MIKLHFAPQNKEENPLLTEGSHFAPQNKEDSMKGIILAGGSGQNGKEKPFKQIKE